MKILVLDKPTQQQISNVLLVTTHELYGLTAADSSSCSVQTHFDLEVGQHYWLVAATYSKTQRQKIWQDNQYWLADCCEQGFLETVAVVATEQIANAAVATLSSGAKYSAKLLLGDGYSLNYLPPWMHTNCALERVWAQQLEFVAAPTE